MNNHTSTYDLWMCTCMHIVIVSLFQYETHGLSLHPGFCLTSTVATAIIRLQPTSYTRKLRTISAKLANCIQCRQICTCDLPFYRSEQVHATEQQSLATEHLFITTATVLSKFILTVCPSVLESQWRVRVAALDTVGLDTANLVTVGVCLNLLLLADLCLSGLRLSGTVSSASIIFTDVSGFINSNASPILPMGLLHLA